jgi:hypothetical protein
MYRRRYLAATAAALGTGLAGCAEDGTQASGGNGDANDDSGDGGGDADDAGSGTSDKSVQQLILEAVGHLNTAGIALADVQAQLREGKDPEFAAEEQAARIQQARSKLQTATGKDPSAEERKDIQALSKMVTVLEAMSNTLTRMLSVTETLESLEPKLRNREFEAANDQVDDPVAAVETTVEEMTAAKQAVESVDADRLEDLNLRFAELKDGVLELFDLVTAANTLLQGYVDLIKAGLDLQTGREKSDGGNYEGAAGDMASAIEHANAAKTHFEALDDPPAVLEEYAGSALCQAETMAAALTHFEKAAQAAANDDLRTANEQRNAGEDDLEAAKQC